MDDRFSREELLLGAEKLQKLQSSHVAVFGAGGVGGYVVEALARSGVGAITIIDGDTLTLTNLNRQILALESTLGKSKAETAKNRVLEINPQCRAEAIPQFFTAENAGDFDFSRFDYVADAIDMVTSKLLLISQAKAAGVPVISCMGTGNKLNPMAFRAADITETSVCPLARIMRKELKSRGIDHVKVVFSPEEAKKSPPESETGRGGRPVPGSVAFVPAAAGLLMAAEIVKDLTGGFSEKFTTA